MEAPPLIIPDRGTGSLKLSAQPGPPKPCLKVQKVNSAGPLTHLAGCLPIRGRPQMSPPQREGCRLVACLSITWEALGSILTEKTKQKPSKL